MSPAFFARLLGLSERSSKAAAACEKRVRRRVGNEERRVTTYPLGRRGLDLANSGEGGRGGDGARGSEHARHGYRYSREYKVKWGGLQRGRDVEERWWCAVKKSQQKPGVFYIPLALRVVCIFQHVNASRREIPCATLWARSFHFRFSSKPLSRHFGPIRSG